MEPLAAELAEAAFEAVHYLDAPGFRPAVWAWARAEASVRLLFDHVQEHGLIGEDGKPTVSL